MLECFIHVCTFKLKKLHTNFTLGLFGQRADSSLWRSIICILLSISTRLFKLGSSLLVLQMHFIDANI